MVKSRLAYICVCVCVYYKTYNFALCLKIFIMTRKRPLYRERLKDQLGNYAIALKRYRELYISWPTWSYNFIELDPIFDHLTKDLWCLISYRESPSASVDTCTFLSSFVCSSRTLLIDGRVELKRGLQRQERHLFLFNDLFVVAKIK